MPSTESDALRRHFQSMSDRVAANPEMDLTTLRSMMEELGDRASEPENVTYSEVESGGVRGIWCTPLDVPNDQVVLYAHGGGFIGNSASSHRKLAGHLAKAMGTRTFVVEYRLAPEHPFPAQLDDTLAAHRWLLDQGFGRGGVVVAGDSAGGNIAVGIALKLRELGEPLPAAIIAFSPWLDMELVGETLDSNANTDAFVDRSVVEMMSAMYLGESGSRTDPFANPLHADMTGMPPMFLTAGGAETLRDNAEMLADRVRRADVEVELTVSPQQQHVFPFMAGRAPEADEVIRMGADWALSKLKSD